MNRFRRFIAIKTSSEKRLAVLLVFLIFGWGGLQAYQHWTPAFTLQTAHYRIASTETRENTQLAGEKAESLHFAYHQVFGEALNFENEPEKLLSLRLYANREEFRRSNVLARGYAEALYYPGKACHQYFDSKSANPWHWMIHEATHQLNHELANPKLKLWLDEGLACCFSTSFIDRENRLQPGKLDFNTYPIWWLTDVELSGDWATDVELKRVIPLKQLIRDNGPDRSRHFNTYYLHWWSWVHFLFHGEEGRYRAGLIELVPEGGTIRGFERSVGPISELEAQWYRHYQHWANAVQPKR